MLNRTEQPELKPIDSIDFIEPAIHTVSGDVKLYHTKEVPNETLRFDLYFDAGKIRGKRGLPSFTNGLLLSGTDQKSSIEINEEINGLGGFFESGVSMENSVISMYCLRENLIPLFNATVDAIKNVAFIESEVKQLLAERKQRFQVSMEKVGYLAQRKFQAELFASDDRYNDLMELEDFDNITLEKLKEFHEEHYLKGLTKIVVVGDVNTSDINHIIENCISLVGKEKEAPTNQLTNNSGQFVVEKKGALQSAIRVGKTLFNKKHEDYLDFLILNTILGDYFGSRLMSNIREDKGYTYGIGSMIAEYKNTGYFMIATEVGKDVRDAAINEIKNELNRIQNETIPQEEIELVKNYMLGQLLKSADGPYAMMDLYLSALANGKDLELYNKAIEHINNITPERLQVLAKKHLDWDSLTIVSAG